MKIAYYSNNDSNMTDWELKHFVEMQIKLERFQINGYAVIEGAHCCEKSRLADKTVMDKYSVDYHEDDADYSIDAWECPYCKKFIVDCIED